MLTFYIHLFTYLIYKYNYIFICVFIHIFFLSLFIKSRPTYQVEKINEVGVCQRLVCQKREFTVRSSSCEI